MQYFCHINRITEELWTEHLEIYQVQPSCSKHQLDETSASSKDQLEHVAQDFVQSAFNYLQV